MMQFSSLATSRPIGPLHAAALAATIAFALVACDAAEESATEAAIESSTGMDADVERDGDRTVIRTAEGELAVTAGEDLELPGDFPGDVFLPDDYHLQNLVDVGDGNRAFALVTDGPIEQLTSDASARMERDGWDQVVSTQYPHGHMLGFEKSGRSAMMTFTPAEGGQVQVGLTLASQQ